MNTNGSSGNGIGLGGVLFVVFLVLKLTGVIGWSWWWVTGPLWIPAVIVIIAFAVICVVATVKRRAPGAGRAKP